MRRYVFSGTRNRLSKTAQDLIEGTLLSAGLVGFAITECEWHVGDSPTGVDAFISGLAAGWRIKVITHKADWEQYGKRAGPIRNRSMLDAGPVDRLFAFPARGGVGQRRSTGTIDCIKAALVRDIDMTVVWL